MQKSQVLRRCIHTNAFTGVAASGGGFFTPCNAVQDDCLRTNAGENACVTAREVTNKEIRIADRIGSLFGEWSNDLSGLVTMGQTSVCIRVAIELIGISEAFIRYSSTRVLGYWKIRLK